MASFASPSFLYGFFSKPFNYLLFSPPGHLFFSLFICFLFSSTYYEIRDDIKYKHCKNEIYISKTIREHIQGGTSWIIPKKNCK